MKQPIETYTPIHDETALDRAVIPHEFQKLTRIAESLCLSRPLELYDVPKQSPEAAVLAKLGSHGLRMAIEITEHAEFATEFESGVNTTDVICVPDLYNHESYPEAVAWAEAFGAALLDEAYMTLGEDTAAKIAEFRAARTVDEQMAVIEWVDTPLSAMKETDDVGEDLAEGDDENYLVYHPIRLSPKAIGRYPELTLPPTCLGMSSDINEGVGASAPTPSTPLPLR